MNSQKFLQTNNIRLTPLRHQSIALIIYTIILLFQPFSHIFQDHDAAAETPAALVEALQARNIEIVVREKKISEREDRLKILEKEVKKMLDHYIKLKEEIDRRESEEVKALEKEKEKKIARLAKIYQAMKPKDAATRIKNMKKTTALSLLRKIKEKQAAKILSNLSPEKATQFSEAFIKPDP